MRRHDVLHADEIVALLADDVDRDLHEIVEASGLLSERGAKVFRTRAPRCPRLLS
jgi:hypothetical protein